MGNRFGKVRASCRSIAGAFVIGTCEVGKAGLSEMLCQQFRFALRHGREAFFQCPRDPFVDLLPSCAQQVVVSYVTHQGMLEAVAGFARLALGKGQPGIDETRDPRCNVTRGSRSHRLQERIRKLLPNHGRNLGNLLCRPEPIEPRHQRILQSGGDGGPIGRRGLHHCFGQLFDEKWYTTGLGHDVFDQSWSERLGRGDAGD